MALLAGGIFTDKADTHHVACKYFVFYWCSSGKESIESDDAEEVKFLDSSLINQSACALVRTQCFNLVASRLPHYL